MRNASTRARVHQQVHAELRQTELQSVGPGLTQQTMQKQQLFVGGQSQSAGGQSHTGGSDSSSNSKLCYYCYYCFLDHFAKVRK